MSLLESYLAKSLEQWVQLLLVENKMRFSCLHIYIVPPTAIHHVFLFLLSFIMRSCICPQHSLQTHCTIFLNRQTDIIPNLTTSSCCYVKFHSVSLSWLPTDLVSPPSPALLSVLPPLQTHRLSQSWWMCNRAQPRLLPLPHDNLLPFICRHN